MGRIVWLVTATEAGSSAFLGRGLLRTRSRRLGGRAVGRSGACRLCGVSHSDEVDVRSAQHFVFSSLAPVLLFRRRLKSVADVLKGIRNRGFTQARWEALQRFWDAVCRHGPCGPICSLHPWDGWVPPRSAWFLFKVGPRFYWISLNDFTKQVVASRQETGIRKWD